MVKNVTLVDPYESKLYCYLWETKKARVRGVIQIIHGASEHLGRYEHFAQKCVDAGYHVIGHDLLGHGKSSIRKDRIHFTNELGFHKVYEGIKTVRDYIEDNYPEYDVMMFGHSMGSLFGRYTLIKDHLRYKAAVFSGTGDFNPLSASFAKLLSWFIVTFKGKEHISPFFNHRVLEGHIRSMKKNGLINRRVEWLTQDMKKVQAFINDPYCGREFTIQAQRDLLTLVKEIQSKPKIKEGASSMPILFISGELDGLGEYGEGIKRLRDKYSDLGYSNVHFKILNNCRHEVINEIDRDSYMSNIISFFNNN